MFGTTIENDNILIVIAQNTIEQQQYPALKDLFSIHTVNITITLVENVEVLIKVKKILVITKGS